MLSLHPRAYDAKAHHSAVGLLSVTPMPTFTVKTIEPTIFANDDDDDWKICKIDNIKTSKVKYDSLSWLHAVTRFSSPQTVKT